MPNYVDPGVEPLPEESDTEEAGTVATSQGEDERHTGDTDPFEKAYLAIDGIEADDISDADSERLERAVTEFMLTNGYSISGVRLIEGDTNVIEIESE